MYEKIYNKNDTEENLKKITKKNTEYEVFLKKISKKILLILLLVILKP